MRYKWIKLGGAAVLVVLTIIQIMLLQRDFDNPPVINEPVWPSAYVEGIARRACFDCHSNETRWPWYAYLAPMMPTVERDVVKGRAVLNFSEWPVDCCREDLAEAMVDTVSQGEMPLPYYVALHPEAQLTFYERGVLTNGLLELIVLNDQTLDNDP